MNNRTLKRRLVAGLVGSVSLVGLATATAAHAGTDGPELGFTPITTNALSCSTTGLASFAPGSDGEATVPKLLMQTGDPATPINAPATSNKVGRVNDMIALSPDGKYLYTVSENGTPAENNIGINDSDGVTRLTLKGKNKGKKEILANNVDATGKNLWSRVDGVKWYPYGGPDEEGVLLLSEEFNAGGVWLVNPETGAFSRLDWIGNYAHEGIGLDAKGDLYLGDENRGGAIYKAEPNDVHDLTKGGTLSYMVGTGVDASGWKQVVTPANAVSEATKGGAILFDRPEDFDEANGRVYFTVTEPAADADTRKGPAGQVVNRGGVYSMNTKGVPELSVQSGALPYDKLAPMIEVNDPKYATAADAKAQQGLQFPDNIAFDGNGNLWVHEDVPDGASFPASGVDVSKQVRDQQDKLYVFVLNHKGDAIKANPDTTGPGISGGYKAADLRSSAKATPCENEFSGGIFAEDGRTLYLNPQHADNPTLKVRFED